MAAIQNLCKRSILLQSGCISSDGATAEAISKYLDTKQEHNRFSPKTRERIGDQNVKIKNFWVYPDRPQTGKPIDFIFEIINHKSSTSIPVDLAVAILSEINSPIFQLYSRHMGRDFYIKPGRSIVKVSLDSLPLAPGNYHLNLWVGAGSIPIDWVKDCFVLSVETGFFEDGEFIEAKGYPVLVKSNWFLESLGTKDKVGR
jgi:lipopolysaccharide transport system ATP-binding protein